MSDEESEVRGVTSPSPPVGPQSPTHPQSSNPRKALLAVLNNKHTSPSEQSPTMSAAASQIKPVPASKPPQTPQPPQTKPIEVFSNDTSRLAANLHPILLSSVLIFSFKSLVRDPVNTLIGLAPTVAIVQLAYCVICLPSTGQPPPPAHKPGQKKKIAKPVQDLGTKAVV